MEPLLDLMAQFARDLGAKFERHFAPAVSLVASIAATHSSIEVIEWSFTCLAWIFKFLSRLLVPDLRQLLGIMSPYLGKERQKHYVSKFAAESMSFLLRKAATIYHKNKAPLERAVAFLFEDLCKTSDARQTKAYQSGLVGMFSEAIKGVKGMIHSTGPDILRCIIDAVPVEDEAQSILAEDVLGGVLVNLIHHTTADTFAPLLDVILNHIETGQTKFPSAAASVDARLIFLSVTANKGSGVQDWKGIFRVMLVLLQRSIEPPDIGMAPIRRLLSAVVVAVQTSPMDKLLPYMCHIMEAVAHGHLSKYFLPFCSLFSSLGTDRFRSVVLPYFQR
jgi:U3 small nucleolar RNA-associated protein 20